MEVRCSKAVEVSGIRCPKLFLHWLGRGQKEVVFFNNLVFLLGYSLCQGIKLAPEVQKSTGSPPHCSYSELFEVPLMLRAALKDHYLGLSR